ncbi:MAG: hypothetical protein ACOCRZ_06495 [Halothermotrichaceae bacterium]
MVPFLIQICTDINAITGIWYLLTPKEIVHSWVEVFYNNQWFNLEGFILDLDYLSAVQANNNCDGSFCGYGVATKNLFDPQIEWDENNTYIQKEEINKDFGIFDDPDEFFNKHKQNINCVKKFLFQNVLRHIMNKNVKAIRKSIP